MVPGREGERPCRRLALLQPEAQLPVTRVGEQGAPPRRVGRLLSGCGARPPLSPRFDRFRPGRGAGPTLSLHSRYEHSMLAALGVDPDRAHRRPKIFPLAASLFRVFSIRAAKSGAADAGRHQGAGQVAPAGGSSVPELLQPSAAPGQVLPLLALRSMIEQSPTSCYGRGGPATFTFSQHQPSRLEPTTTARFVGRKTWVGFGS